MTKQAPKEVTCIRLSIELLSGADFHAKKSSPVLRVIDIRDDQTLDDLHQAVFDAFDRWDEHLYHFCFGSKRPYDSKGELYGIEVDEDPIFGPPVHDALAKRLSSFNFKKGSSFHYLFDFGDDWWHSIKVVSVGLPVDPHEEYPVLRQRLGESPKQYPISDEKKRASFSMDDIPEGLRPAVLRIHDKLEPVCKTRLNDEYLELCLRLLRDACLAGLAVGSGKPEAWAAGLVHAVGRVNFLFDPAMNPHLPAKEIPILFSISTGTMQNRSNLLCDEFDLGPWSIRYMTEEMRQKTPFPFERIVPLAMKILS